jgi:hypothetical protein
MALYGVRVYEHIVNKGIVRSSYDVPENGHHQPLEGGWGVAVTLLYHIADVRPHDRGEHHFLYVIGFDSNLLICVS